MTFVHFEFCK